MSPVHGFVFHGNRSERVNAAGFCHCSLACFVLPVLKGPAAHRGRANSVNCSHVAAGCERSVSSYSTLITRSSFTSCGVTMVTNVLLWFISLRQHTVRSRQGSFIIFLSSVVTWHGLQGGSPACRGLIWSYYSFLFLFYLFECIFKSFIFTSV